jgi:hypothetical protein
MAHFVPTRKADDAKALAKDFIQHVVRLHGLPKEIISDRGVTFMANGDA